MIEGPQAVREAVRYAGTAVRDLYLSAPAAERYAEILDDARAAGLRTHLGTPEVLAAMSADAQGVLAVADRTILDVPLPVALTAVGERSNRSPRLAAVLAHVRDPGNAGTVIRVADAAGADLVVLAGHSVATDNPKLIRATAGSLFHLPVIEGGDLTEVLGALRSAGLAVIAADGSGDLDLDDLVDVREASRAPGRVTSQTHPLGPDTRENADLRLPTAWLFGNEAWGLPEADRELADAVVRVPIFGAAESLNLATAAAVCLYSSARAHRPRRTVPGDDTP